MKDALSPALNVLRRIEGAGYEAVLVGGIVRDLLSGNPPEDVDIASAAPFSALGSIFPEGKVMGPRGMEVFILPVEGGHCEIFSYAGSSLKRDLARRDFTVNALALRISGELEGSGQAVRDVSARILRFNGSGRARLQEDPLRALRLARFASILPGFVPDPASLALCRAFSPDLGRCSPERVGREIRLGLEGMPHVFLSCMREEGLLPFLLQGTAPGKRDFLRLCTVEQTMAMRGGGLSLRASALFSGGKDAPSPDEEGAERALEWACALKWPLSLAVRISRLVRLRGIPSSESSREVLAAILLHEGEEFLNDLFLLGESLARNGKQAHRLQKNRAAFTAMRIRNKNRDVLPSGDALMAHFGLPGGPLVGEILRRLRMELLVGDIQTGEECFPRAWSLLENGFFQKEGNPDPGKIS